MRRNQDALMEMRKNQEFWVNLYEGLNKVLKTVGDLSNYANYVSNELAFIVGEPIQELN